ncbi:hypothetical protein BJF93_23335 [Xaviernesmea oryzae]|uniref:Permuted papain-like amidase YaeF/Yiix C92 family enzyme n=2 Tax=Xaviernesmea oryzae TaxID=464029 RepID=A0A1Q9B301_9HYPH|nr:hypothetical protein BJF93_23335 [Xaviernesmea oryzae]SEL96041.1 Permuted papain-like amidase enzyme, YaeF/YiiX, C92 family [Xaviernesmea oryzae]
MKTKRAFIGLSLAVLLVFGWIAVHAKPDLPPLDDGDLIFQTSTSSQSLAILMATASTYTHMGIIRHRAGQLVVIEAAGRVRETPLDAWIARGLFKRVAIYRDPALTPAQVETVLTSAGGLYGRPYDIFFSFENDAIYCSELPYRAYQAAGIELGRVQTVSELNMDNVAVKSLIRKRWQSHAPCKENGFGFDQCYAAILQQTLITPVSIADDKRLRLVFSNYPL